MATYGYVILATGNGNTAGTTVTTGTSDQILQQFSTQGKFTGRAPGNTCAITRELGKVSSAQSVNFVVGHYRENAINYLGKAQTGYFRSKNLDVKFALDAFLKITTLPMQNQPLSIKPSTLPHTRSQAITLI